MLRQVALYGGSFDPPHWGHVDNVAFLSRHPSIDHTVVMPCYQQTGKALSPWADRYAMACRAFGAIPRVTVSPLERELGGESLTLRTVRALKASPAFEGATIRLVIGADLVARLAEWEGGAELVEEAPPLVLSRTGFDGGTCTGAAAWRSTDIRASAKAHLWRYVQEACPESVHAYIRENGLYCDCGDVTTPVPSSFLRATSVVSGVL